MSRFAAHVRTTRLAGTVRRPGLGLFRPRVVVGVGDGDSLPLPQAERLMLCDPLQLQACRGMLRYCERSPFRPPTSTHDGFPSGYGALRAPWQTYGVPSTCYSTEPIPLATAIEDPDERPYVWDLED